MQQKIEKLKQQLMNARASKEVLMQQEQELYIQYKEITGQVFKEIECEKYLFSIENDIQEEEQEIQKLMHVINQELNVMGGV